MNAYPSIETIYTRDKETNLLRFGEQRMPETALVSEWTVSEKIDGTNIRATYHFNEEGEPTLTIKGRTDKAQFPPGLVEAVNNAMPAVERAVEYFTEYRGKELHPNWSVTFYGEGYGPGIQKGGMYSNEKRFRVFDLKLGESLWTDDDEMRGVCEALEIPVVPLLGWIDPSLNFPVTSEELAEWFKNREGQHFAENFAWGSIVAHEDRGVWNVQPEGIVAKPTVVLLDKRGERVMWKLTFREFK